MSESELICSYNCLIKNRRENVQNKKKFFCTICIKSLANFQVK